MNFAGFLRLGDLCSLITKGTTPTTLGFEFSNVGIPFLRAQNVSGNVDVAQETLFISPETHSALARSSIAPGDVLLTIAGTIGRAAIVPPDAPAMNCNQAVAILRPLEGLDRRYLFHWLQSQDATGQIFGSTVTGTISNLSLGQISGLRLSLPPLDEQRRIAAILDKVDALRQKRKRIIDLLDSLMQSTFLGMFGNGLMPNHRLGDLCLVRGGKRLPKGHDYVSDERATHRYLRVTDLQVEGLTRDNLRRISDETHQVLRRYVVAAGDTVISIAGTIGTTRAIDSQLDGVNLTENAALIRPKIVGAVDNVFLEYCLRTPQVRSQIHASTGKVTIGKLALFRIEELEIPFPPKESQSQFRRAICNLAVKQAKSQQALGVTERLLASLQHRAFSGQL